MGDAGGRDPELDVLTVGSALGEVAPPRLGVRFEEAAALTLYPSGSATIFCMALAALGGRVGLASRVGDDDLGRWLIAALRRGGVDVATVALTPGQLTPVSLASVDARGRKTFSFYRFPGYCDPLATLRSEDVSDAALLRARVFDFTEASLRAADARAVAFALARRARGLGRAVCYTPNYRASGWAGGEAEARRVQREALALADLALMNDGEARLIADDPDLDRAVAWLAANGPPTTVITRGLDPLLVLHGERVDEVPAFPVAVVYDIGAGDVFHAAFLAAWRPGADPVACARFAAAASALKISRPAETEHLPTRAEVLAFLKERMAG